MKILVPMAGQGERFVKMGYLDPKPLIKVNGKRIIEYIVEMFSKEDDFIFICNEDHLKQTDMEAILKSLPIKSCEIVSIPSHNKGPVSTILNICDMFSDEEEIIVCYCDNPYVWDYEKFKKHVRDTNSDGCILTHSGFHPHRLSSTYMAYLKVTDGVMDAIQEKKPYTNNHMNEHASTGTYYFKKGSYIKKYFKELVDKNINYNGEYYVTLVYNLLKADGLKTTIYDTDITMVFGTPEEVQNFDAWATIINSTQVKTKEDAIACYEYWKEYFEGMK
jgi:bifunctional N-acetylglucosamine-1-phosphate-uridyltransferase/glucosamine-1-phosphate-acetyltransferase GlmU-like protein